MQHMRVGHFAAFHMSTAELLRVEGITGHRVHTRLAASACVRFSKQHSTVKVRPSMPTVRTLSQWLSAQGTGIGRPCKHNRECRSCTLQLWAAPPEKARPAAI